MADTIISTRNLSKRFGDFYAVRDISFEVQTGEVFGFLGANGAGKTTAMKMLCGLWAPSSGEATVAGYDIYRQREKIKASIGYMSQKFSLYEDLTVMENITFFGGIYGLRRGQIQRRASELIDLLGLKEVQDSLLASLPLGWKQKLAFSIALFHEPKIVFLDEPTGGVDPITRRQFWESIYATASEGTTLFVTTHYMDEAEYCDRISMMVDGEIRGLDSPKALKEAAQAETMDDVFVKIAREDLDLTT